MAITPEEKIKMISVESIRDTPLELMRDAMLQHFEEERILHSTVQTLSQTVMKLENHFNPDHDSYVLKPLVPYMQGVAGLGLLWKALIAIGGLIILWMQIRGK